MRSTCIELSTSALKYNLKAVKRLAPHSKVLAMIKANAYGHGVSFAVPALNEADGLGIASLDEARYVIKAGCHPAQQLVLIEGVFAKDEWLELQTLTQQQKFGVVIHNQPQLEWALQTPLPSIPIWLKINSGMNRLGWYPSDAIEAASQLHQAGYKVILTSHFANADIPNHPLNEQQISVLIETKNKIESITAQSVQLSAANSAAIMAFPQWHFDWVRPGIMLYGSSPFGTSLPINNTSVELKPVMRFTAPLISCYSVKKGAAVGYGSRWQASRDSMIGIVAAGYGDGYPRVMRNASVSIDGTLAPILGRVSMDLLIIDLTDLPTKPQLNTMVELWGPNLSIDLVAECNSTISYELMCRLSPRPERKITS